MYVIMILTLLSTHAALYVPLKFPGTLYANPAGRGLDCDFCSITGNTETPSTGLFKKNCTGQYIHQGAGLRMCIEGG